MAGGGTQRRCGALLAAVVALAAACSDASPTDVAAPDASAVPASVPVPVRADPGANPFRTGRTLVIPHAGGDGLFPENTIFAYEQSLDLGGDVVDIDVQMTADAVPIAFHDHTLERTTNGTGRVAATPYDEIAQLDAGWQFERDGGHPFRGQGLVVPTVEAVLQRFPTTLTTLDLKDQRVAVVGPVCDVLRRLGRTVDVYVGIDTNEQVLAFREQCPEVRTSGTDDERQAMRTARESGDTTFTTKQLVSQPRHIDDDGSLRITEETLAFSHRHDIAVLTYLVDDPAMMETLIRLGVDGLYTRRPDVMVAVRADIEAELQPEI